MIKKANFRNSTSRLPGGAGKLSRALIIISLVAGLTLGQASFQIARAQEGALLGFGLLTAAIVWIVQKARFSPQAEPFTISFACPEGLQIYDESRGRFLNGSRVIVSPEQTYSFIFATPWGKYEVTLTTQKSNLPSDLDYEACLAPELFQMVRKEGTKKVQLQDDRGREIFSLMFVAKNE